MKDFSINPKHAINMRYLNEPWIKHPVFSVLLAFLLIFFGFLFTIFLGLFILSMMIWRWRHIFIYAFCFLFGVERKNSGEHLFEEREFRNGDGELLGEIKYEGDYPVLKMYSRDPKICGYVHGILLGPQLYKLIMLGLRPMLFVAKTLKMDFFGKKLKRVFKDLHLPYEEEIEGIADGVELWARYTGVKVKRDFLLKWIKRAHVLTDCYKCFGCSAVAYKKDGKFVVGRLLDWFGMGMIGKEMLEIRYIPSGFSLCTFPGYIGGLTGWNDKGLVLFIDELGTARRWQGTPHNMFARRILEECKDLREVKNMIKTFQNSTETQCASSVTLMVADKDDAKLFQFYPHGDGDWKCYETEMVDGYLCVTNHFIDEDGSVPKASIANSTTEKRYRNLERALLSSGSVEDALRAAGMFATIAMVVVNQTDNTRKVVSNNFLAYL